MLLFDMLVQLPPDVIRLIACKYLSIYSIIALHRTSSILHRWLNKLWLYLICRDFSTKHNLSRRPLSWRAHYRNLFNLYIGEIRPDFRTAIANGHEKKLSFLLRYYNGCFNSDLLSHLYLITYNAKNAKMSREIINSYGRTNYKSFNPVQVLISMYGPPCIPAYQKIIYIGIKYLIEKQKYYHEHMYHIYPELPLPDVAHEWMISKKNRQLLHVDRPSTS